MKNFTIRYGGSDTAPTATKSFLTDVGTSYRFLVTETGELIARRLIPVRYVGAV